MNDEEIAKKKLKKIAATTDLSAAIEKLERKKELMEDDFKDSAHYLLENLNPVNIVNRTLEKVKESSSSKYILFKEALQFGAGHLSKKNLIGQLKTDFIKTFNIPVHTTTREADVAINNQADMNNNRNIEDDKKKMK